MRTTCSLLAMVALVAPLSAQAPKVRDSAGVRIVENAARASAPTTFGLAAKPTYDVGGLKDNPDDELYKNSAYLKAIRLSDGRYVVDDEIRLRFFDAGGKQQRVVGRQGQGPGEFQYVDALCRIHGDTIIADDPGNSRVTIFDKTGSMIREIPVGRTYLLRDGCLDDGSFVLTETLRPTGAPATINLVHRALDGTILGSAGEFPSRPPGFFLTDRLMFAAHGQRVYLCDPRSGEVQVYSPQGKLISVIRTADPIEKTTAAEQEAMQPTSAPGTTDQAILDRFKERLRSTPRPTEWPAYHQMKVDPDGRLWLEEYAKTRAAPLIWTAFDATGRLLGRLAMPADQKNGDPRIIAFTSGGVLIEHDDDDGAHHLTVYALEGLARHQR